MPNPPNFFFLQTSKIKKHCSWLLPLFILILLTPFTPFLDLTTSNFFFNKETSSFVQHPFLKAIYHLGVLPGLLTAAIALFFLVGTFFCTSWKRFLAPALSLILTLAIGSGLIINTILKENWNRPRPKQTLQFGGQQKYRPYYLPNLDTPIEPSKSFPSGHASMGFYFFSLSLIFLRHKRKKLFIYVTIISIILGGLLSFTRIAQGGHFFSDVIISAFIMWLTALCINWWLYDKLKLHTLKKESV